ncbi:MAG: electron transport complex subunit RsxA [Bacillota bacterium]|nr:electron transport complex subunit RsxA [Bacillota bacterium]
MLTKLVLIVLGSILVNNFVLTRFLGICPFLGVSTSIENSLSMGAATTFVMTLSAAAAWMIQAYILTPFGLPFLQSIIFILVIASLVQLVEMFILKTSPALHRALGIYLPLITTNCAILGLALLVVIKGYSLVESAVFAVGAGLGFTLALVIMAGIRQELRFADVPKPLQGFGIALIIAGLMSLAFMGFTGLITV